MQSSIEDNKFRTNDTSDIYRVLEELMWPF